MAIQASMGARVGDYILAKKLGEGGMAEVWLARHFTSGQLRAIKFLNQQFQGIPEVEARFQTEGESQLVHPNIVRIFQVGQETGSSYLVMAFIDGRDLEKILDSRRGPLTVPEAVDVAMQIVAGLGFAHASGIIHRDIKPSNVLVDSEGQAYLMDFGIAKALGATRSVTQVNSRLGTPDYMSPEQIRNPRDVDRRSDIYSFGCLFYELLTGWPPFDRGAGYETEHDIKTAHCTALPTPPVERKSNLPAALNDIALQCLEKAKEDRPQSCEEILAALDAYRASMARPLGSSIPGGEPFVQPKITTDPGGVVRRETVVIPQEPNVVPKFVPKEQPFVPKPQPLFGGDVAQPGSTAASGFGDRVRTPTVTDDSLPGMRDAQKTAQAGGQVGSGGQAANAGQPFVPVKTPPYVPYVPQVVATQQPPKGLPKALIAVGSVLLVAALGGGAWAVFHKNDPGPSPGPGPDPTPAMMAAATPFFSPSGGDYVSPQTVRVTIHDSTPDAKIHFTTDGSTPTASSPEYTVPITVDSQETLKAIAIAPGFSDSSMGTGSYVFAAAAPPPIVVPKNEPKPIVKIKPPVTLASGTLSWTGFITAAGTHLTIVRSANQVWKAGQMGQAVGTLSGSMFPAGAIEAHVTGGHAILVLPKAATNYNSMEMFTPDPGQQTIVIHWKALPNSQ